MNRNTKKFSLVSLLVAVLFACLLCGDVYANGGDSRRVNGSLELIAEGLAHPYGLYWDNTDLLVTHEGEFLKIDHNGTKTHIAAVTMGPPSGIMVYGGDYYVVDNIGRSLLRINRNGSVATMVQNQIGNPVGIARDGRDFIIVDIDVKEDTHVGYPHLYRVTPEGVVTVIAEGPQLGGPAEVIVVNGDYYVTDFILGRLLKVTRNGQVSVVARNLGQPLDLEYDGKDFIVTDFHFGFTPRGVNRGRILRITPRGEVFTLVKDFGNPSGILIQGPDIIFTDVPKGTIWRLRGYRSTKEMLQSNDKR